MNQVWAGQKFVWVVRNFLHDRAIGVCATLPVCLGNPFNGQCNVGTMIRNRENPEQTKLHKNHIQIIFHPIPFLYSSVTLRTFSCGTNIVKEYWFSLLFLYVSSHLHIVLNS